MKPLQINERIFTPKEHQMLITAIKSIVDELEGFVRNFNHPLSDEASRQKELAYELWEKIDRLSKEPNPTEIVRRTYAIFGSVDEDTVKTACESKIGIKYESK